MKGPEEVRENRLEILTSEYEHFKSTSGGRYLRGYLKGTTS